MKKLFTLLSGLIICFALKSQTITDPSSSPGYDQQKIASINPTPITSQTLVTDSFDYQPGSTATITGGGFLPGETVTLQVGHQGALATTGQDHQPWTVTANSSGGFITTWHVCEDDCVGEHLIATADGGTSGYHAVALFTDNLILNGYFPPNSTY